MQTFDFQKFLVQLPNISRDEQGFFRSYSFDIGGVSATSGVTGNDSGMVRLIFDDSGEVARFNFMVPLDYDANSDALKLVVSARALTTTTNTLEIDTVLRWAPGDTSVDSITVPTGGASQVIVPDVQAKYSFDLSGMDLNPGEAITIELGCTIAGNNVKVNAAELCYRSSLVAFVEADA